MGLLTRLLIGRRALDWPVAETNGRYAIYPHWIFGRGLLVDEEKKVRWKKHEQKSLELVLWAMSAWFLAVWIIGVIDPLLATPSSVFLILAVCFVFGAIYGWFAITSGKILAGVERTLPRPTLTDHIGPVAERASWPRAIFGFLAIAIVNSLLVYLLAIHSESWG